MKGVEAYLLLILGWLIFFFSHSYFASTTVKLNIQKRLHLSPKAYRLIYNIIVAFILLAALFINGIIVSERLLPATKFLKYISLFLAGGGVIVINAAFKQYDFRSFVGFRQEEATKLNTEGILAHVRHPIYSGTILIVMGLLLYDFRVPTLVSAICIFIYLPIGIWLEERKLMDAFGDEYKRYKSNTPAVMPKIKLF